MANKPRKKAEDAPAFGTGVRCDGRVRRTSMRPVRTHRLPPSGGSRLQTASPAVTYGHDSADCRGIDCCLDRIGNLSVRVVEELPAALGQLRASSVREVVGTLQV